jgi:capsular polysaccharide export protein
MNVAVILNYFKYFTHYPKYNTRNNYFFVTFKKRYLNTDFTPLYFCDWKDYRKITITNGSEKWEDYFKLMLRLGQDQIPILPRVAKLYENYFEAFFEKNKIDLLISGGTSGFERCGLATAKKVGIKSLCAWEGFFRPNTISIDKDGMNAESYFYKNASKGIIDYKPSDLFKDFFSSYMGSSNSYENLNANAMLRKIHGDRFKILKQVKNRFEDRHDLERIRLPFYQHFGARLNYYLNSHNYKSMEQISKPFIFFPLQTHTDSNIVFNGTLLPYRKYVDLVIDSFKRISKRIDISFVIKEHPHDLFRTNYPKPNVEGVYWLHPAIPVTKILSSMNCLGTIVVNSTAGFESLLMNKPVLALANAVYDKYGLVLKPEILSVENVSDLLEKLINIKVDPEKVYSFAAYLFDEMQIEGNLDSIPELNEVLNFEKRMMKI